MTKNKPIQEIKKENSYSCKKIMKELEKYAEKRDLTDSKKNWKYYLDMTNQLWRRLPEHRYKQEYPHLLDFNQLPKNRIFSLKVTHYHWPHIYDEFYVHFFKRKYQFSGELSLHKFSRNEKTKYATFNKDYFGWKKEIEENTKEHALFSKMLEKRFAERNYFDLIIEEIKMNINDPGFRIR